MKNSGYRRRAPRLAMTLVALSATLAVSRPGGAATQTKDAQSGTRTARPFTFVWKGASGGYLGIEVLDLTPELRRHFGVPESQGVMIARVEDRGPAAAAGVRVGDILTRVDGKTVSDALELTRAVRQKKTGETASIELFRDGSPVQTVVSVEERDRQVIDFAGIRLLPKISDGPELDEESVKAFEEAMRGIESRFDSEEWQEKLEKFRELDLSKIQERMKEVEQRLKKLEKELQQVPQEKKKQDHDQDRDP